MITTGSTIADSVILYQTATPTAEVTTGTTTVTYRLNNGTTGSVTATYADGAWEFTIPSGATGSAGVVSAKITNSAAIPAARSYVVQAANTFKATGFSTFNAASDTVTVGTNNDKTGYSLSVTPPTAIQIRTEMDSNSTKLANLDTAVSSRLASLGTNAPAGWINAAAIAASALDNKGNWNTTTPPSVTAIRTEIDDNSTKLADIKAVTDNLATTIPSYVWDAPEGSYEEIGSFGLKLGGVPTAIQIRTEMDDNSTQLAAIVADTNAILVDTGTTLPAILTAIQGTTFDASTDSLEAIRERGDAEWITGSSGGGDATEAKQDDIIADIAALSLSSDVGSSLRKNSGTGDAYTVDGSPVQGAIVEIYSSQGGTLKQRGTTDDDGVFQVYLTAGTYWEVAKLDGHTTIERAVTATGTQEALTYA